MASYHNRLIDGFFIRPFYKMMLNKPITLQDIEAVDIEYYKSMKFIMETDDVESLDMTFTTETDVYGQVSDPPIPRSRLNSPLLVYLTSRKSNTNSNRAERTSK